MPWVEILGCGSACDAVAGSQVHTACPQGSGKGIQTLSTWESRHLGKVIVEATE